MKRLFQKIWAARWPLSAKLLFGVGVLFLLQAFPYTGVFLMLFAAPLWSAPLINLAAISAGFEALTGRIPGWFILVPICWFGLYALAVVREEAGLIQAQSEVSTANAAVVPFNYEPARQDIVADGLTSGIRLKNFVDELLINHALPVVYYEARDGKDRTMRAARVATSPVCETLAERNTGTKVHIRKIHHSRHGSQETATSAPRCIVSFSEKPTRQIIRVSLGKTIERFGGLSVRIFTTRIESDGQQAEVRSASTALLNWFPIPILGCALNSGTPSWNCSAGFKRRSVVRFGTKLNATHSLEKVLDLSSTLPRSFSETDNSEILDRLGQADQRFSRQRYEQLDAFLQDPDSFPRGNKLFRQFENDPEALTPYSVHLIAALEAMDKKERSIGRNSVNATRAVVKLVAQLPDHDIRRNSGRILTVLDGPPRRWHNHARPLMRRTTLLGQAALPVLLGRLDRHHRNKRISWPEADAVIALCRMGLPLAEMAGSKLLEIWRRRNSPRRLARRRSAERRVTHEKPHLDRADKYLYLALLRLGLRDEAGLPKPKGNSKWWPNAWKTVSPLSPADVCEDVY